MPRRARRGEGAEQEEPALLARLEGIRRDTTLVRDPETGPGEAAAALNRLFERQLPSPEQGAALIEDVGLERIRAILGAALSGEPTPAALALAADLELVDGIPGVAADHVLRAQRLGDHPHLRLRLATARGRQGRVVDALEALREPLARDLGLDEGQLLRGELLARLAAWEAESPPACPCGSGRAYGECCQEAAARLLASFHDRESLRSLRQGVEALVRRRPKLDRFVGESLREWREETGLNPDRVDDEQNARLVELAMERAWTTPMDGGERTVLAEFAESARLPSEQLEVVREWASQKAWGLWQVDELGDPGVLLTEYVTGTRIYAHLPPDQREGLRRWSVLLGSFGPVAGVWRSGFSLLPLPPAHARALAWRVLWFAERVGRQTRTGHQPMADWARSVCRELEEGRWLPDRAEPMPRGVAETARSVVSVMLPSLAADALRLGQTPSQPGTDGGAPELIEARLVVPPDEPVPGLDGLTMREAAGREEYAERLEVFLRELEHHQAAAGQEPAAADLRRELGVGLP